MRFATSIFTFLASFALLVLMLTANDANGVSDSNQMLSVFDAGIVGLSLWIINGFIVFRFPKVASALYVLAGAIMLAFGFLDFGSWNGIFVFGIISFAFAAMAWASWLVKVLWTEGARAARPVGRFSTGESLARS